MLADLQLDIVAAANESVEMWSSRADTWLTIHTCKSVWVGHVVDGAKTRMHNGDKATRLSLFKDLPRRAQGLGTLENFKRRYPHRHPSINKILDAAEAAFWGH